MVQNIREGGDEGMPVVLQNEIVSQAFEQLASTLARQVAIRNSNASQTKKVDIMV